MYQSERQNKRKVKDKGHKPENYSVKQSMGRGARKALARYKKSQRLNK